MTHMIFRLVCITFLSTALLASSTALAASGKRNPATYTWSVRIPTHRVPTHPREHKEPALHQVNQAVLTDLRG